MVELEESLAEVFSILPEPTVKGAVRQAMDLAGQTSAAALDFAWADLSTEGTFLRGGVSALDGQTSDLHAKAAGVPRLEAIADEARESCRPGAMVPADDGEALIWFLPRSEEDPDHGAVNRVRGVHVTSAVFDEVVTLFNADARLTRAERRVIWQLCIGLRTRDAAERDGVSVETKRTHVKSAVAKMACAGQTELVRTAVGQLFHLVSVSERNASRTRVAEAFIGRFLGGEVRLTTTHLPGGRLVRVIDAGDPMGTPVLVAHGMLMPAMLIGMQQVLQDVGVRLIVPLRRGYLDAQSPTDLLYAQDVAEGSIDDLIAFAAQTFRRPVPLVGTSLGCSYAVAAIDQRPDLFTALHLVSTHLPDAAVRGTGMASRFFASLKALGNDPGFLRLVSWQFRKHYADEKTVRAAFRKLMSPLDLDILEGGRGGTSAYTWFVDFYRSSIFGIAEDFRMSMGDWRERLPQIERPARIVHGRHDGFSPCDEIAVFAGKAGTPMQTIEDGGHLIYTSHPRAVWEQVVAL